MVWIILLRGAKIQYFDSQTIFLKLDSKSAYTLDISSLVLDTKVSMSIGLQLIML